jgi:acetyl esterase/lipase
LGKSTPTGAFVALRNVSVPTVTVYRPAKNKAAHSAVVLFPGGGYEFLTWNYEGTSTAEALQDHGVTAILVKYRLPSDKTMPNNAIGPLQDAQQAIRLARQHAAEWNIDPDKIGVMGFSAGGHLASTVGTHFNKAYPNPENVDLRPSFMVLIYPVISMTKELTHMGSRTWFFRNQSGRVATTDACVAHKECLGETLSKWISVL